MRDLNNEELAYVYGAGGKGKGGCAPKKNRGGSSSRSKGRSKHGGSSRGKHGSKGRKHGSS